MAKIDLQQLKSLGAKPETFPKQFNPELATLVKEVPIGDEWIFEVKFDGYRLLTFFQNGKVRLISRRGHDWSHKFPLIVKALENLTIENGILDGELVALDPKGASRYQLIQNYLELGQEVSICYYLFDCPFLNGLNLTQVPLLERKKALQAILAKLDHKLIRYSDHRTKQGQAFFKQACSLKLEGIMAKDGQSFYANKRTEDWLKIKCQQRQELIIAGYTDPGGSRQYFGSLLLGYYNQAHQLIYCGRVGTGFNQKLLADLYHQFIPIKQDHSDFLSLPQPSVVRTTHWLKPHLVAEIEFTEWTQDGKIRHPSFKGLRLDKQANEVHIELPKALSTLKKVEK